MQPTIYLYKDHRIKYKNSKKLKKEKMNDENLKMILIPLIEHESCYIPVKPSTLYSADKFYVEMDQQVITYNYENVDIDEGEILHSKLSTSNVIEFINKLYTLYKCRATSIMLEDGNDYSYSMPISHVIIIRRIVIKFLTKNNDIIHEIDTGDMGTIDYRDESWVSDPPPAYRLDGIFNHLKEILFTYGSKSIDMGVEIETLPISIKITDDSWKRVNTPEKELSTNDQLLYRIADFEVYYLMSYAFYTEILAIPEFCFKIISFPVHLDYDENPLPSLETNQIPLLIEKHEFIEKFNNDDIFAVINTDHVILSSLSSFLSILVFLDTICWYTQYISYSIFNTAKNNSTIVKTVAVFYNKDITSFYELLTIPEISSRKRVEEAFIRIIDHLKLEKFNKY